jgi:hypothetical protein
MKKLLVALSASLALLTAGASAHGPATAVHGGVVQTAADLQFELVAGRDGVALYVVDHGKPADSSRLSGKLTVLNGTEKTEAELKPAGANRLQAANVRVGKGAKVVAIVKGTGGTPVTLRFAMP